MRAGKIISALRFQPARLFLIVIALLASVTALATRTPRAIPQTACPSQADCDHLKQISDTAAAVASAAQSVADQAQADREKDLAAASQLDREAEFPSSAIAKDMRTSDRLEMGAAKHAQAKALRAKLPNAQANAKAAAEAAAAALKAYNDCMEKLKACPPPTTVPQTATGTGTPTATGNGRRGGRGDGTATGTRIEALDGTTSSTVLPLKLDYKLETGLRFDWYGDPKDPPLPYKDVYVPRVSRLNLQNGELDLGVPFGTQFGTGNSYIPTFQNDVPTWIIPLHVLETPPDSGGTIQNPAIPGIRLRTFEPHFDYIRPPGYTDYSSQFMDYFGDGLPKSRCQNDFPYTLQKLMGIATAQCRPSKSPMVIASRSRPPEDQPRLQTVSLPIRSDAAEQQTPTQDSSRQNSTSQGRGRRRSRVMPAEGFTYSIVSNGKSTGEAFQLQLADPTGKVKSVQMPEGTVLEAIRAGVTKPVSASGGANLVKQPLNGFCLEFNKHPPVEGTMYRIAGEATQQKYRPLSFLSEAGGQMKQKNAFHPDSDPAAYNDAILQYAVWSKLEGWSQEQFTQHFVERTKENADALHVKWTKEMESALRGAAPGRWKDISEMLQEAQELEKNSGQGRGGRRGGGRGRGGRRGAQGSDQ
jgi:hypothetical protein